MSIAASAAAASQLHTVFVGYQAAPGGHFNIDYYGTTHFALVEKHWKKEGLLSWNVVSFIGDDTAPFHVLAEMVWTNATAALNPFTDSPARDEIVADVPNFTDLSYTLFGGPQTAHSTY